MSGIVVETSPGTTITGVLNAAPGSALPAGLRATVSAHPLRRGTPGRSTSSDRGTGIFTLDGLFGPVTLAVSGLPDGWAVQSVELAGTDVTDRPIDFPPRSRFQATIVVTPRTGTVNGIVTSNRGASQESHIVVFPGDEAKWTYASRFLRSVTQDRQARFRVVSLPPSERYFAIAVDYLEDGELYDPEVLGRLRERATPFSLAGGETRSLELPLVLR